MGTLEALPTELLLDIFAELDTDVLLNFVLVSRIFNQLATPFLYRRVYFVDDGKPGNHEGCGFPDGREPYLGLVNHGARIFDLDVFNDTIEAKGRLQHSVQAASFCWGSEGDVRVERAISLLSPLHFLHLSPTPIPGRTYIDRAANSLQLYAHHLETIPLIEAEQWSEPTVQLLRLHTLFATPNLERLWLDTFHFNIPDDFPITVQRGCSRIAHLTLTVESSPEACLETVLSWPEALRSFKIEVVGSNSHLGGGFGRGNPALARALWQQRASLEVVQLTELCFFSLSDSSPAYLDLREFPHLRVLAVPAVAMIHMEENWWEVAMVATLQHLHLPRGLEILQVQVGHVVQKELLAPTRFAPWLHQMAALKPARFPGLRRLVIWLDSWYWRTEFHTVVLTPTECEAVSVAMSRARLRLLICVARLSPIGYPQDTIGYKIEC